MSGISQSDFQTVDKWLRSLGVLCAGTMTADEARARCAAYASLLSEEFPVEVFDKKNLVEVASRCKFFPSFGEIVTHLGDIRRENLPAHIRMGGSPEQPRIAQERSMDTPEERAAAVARAAAVIAELTAQAEAKKPPHQRPQARYLNGEQLARARAEAGIGR